MSDLIAPVEHTDAQLADLAGNSFLGRGVAKFVTLAHGSLFTVFCILEYCCRDSFGVFFCGHLTRHLTLTDAVGSRMRTRTRMFVLWKFSMVRVRV